MRYFENSFCFSANSLRIASGVLPGIYKAITSVVFQRDLSKISAAVPLENSSIIISGGYAEVFLEELKAELPYELLEEIPEGILKEILE